MMKKISQTPVNARKSAFSGHSQNGSWRILWAPTLILLAWLGWRAVANSEVGEWRKSASTTSSPANFGAREATGAGSHTGASKYGASGKYIVENQDDSQTSNDPLAQQALWQKRLQRAQEVLENYQRSTRYPYDSRPADEHADQMYPNQAVVEEKRLYKPGSETGSELRLRTSQERIFVAGNETVLFTIAAIDADGNLVPLNITAAGIVDPPQGNVASTQKRIAAYFSPAADGVWSYRFSPATQGFGNYTGLLRMEMNVEVERQQGFTYFDMYYTPAPPAVWTGALREVIENGSLNVYMKVNVRTAGRYVASGRFDDNSGKPFALGVFNQELAAGNQEILFRAYGKLMRDSNPPQPLRLRDVDGFLLLEDVNPDRALMPRLMGAVHTTKQYPLESFTDAEWQSEERDRYVREYLNDVTLAKLKLLELEKIIGAPKKPG